MKSYALIISIILLMACKKSNSKIIPSSINPQSEFHDSKSIQNDLLNPHGKTIEKRFLNPNGYRRINTLANSFEHYLRNLPLKPNDSNVKYFNNNIKENHNIYDAVIDLDIGNKNLHQCADAVIRLKAEYLWQQKEFDKIHFNFTNGFQVDYSEWMKGKRIVVNGNITHWEQKKSPSKAYDDFWEYLEIVFMYAGTLSLSKELKSVNVSELNIGDVFIQGGSPGHAIIVVDLAINPKNNQKVFLLAQSYMPAQEIQILKNPNDEKLSPWYSAGFGTVLNTPEWTFYSDDLKRFVN